MKRAENAPTLTIAVKSPSVEPEGYPKSEEFLSVSYHPRQAR